MWQMYTPLCNWRLREALACECGMLQTIDHIVNDCSIYSFPGGITECHMASLPALERSSKFSLGLLLFSIKDKKFTLVSLL